MAISVIANTNATLQRCHLKQTMASQYFAFGIQSEYLCVEARRSKWKLLKIKTATTYQYNNSYFLDENKKFCAYIWPHSFIHRFILDTHSRLCLALKMQVFNTLPATHLPLLIFSEFLWFSSFFLLLLFFRFPSTQRSIQR